MVILACVGFAIVVGVVLALITIKSLINDFRNW